VRFPEVVIVVESLEPPDWICSYEMPADCGEVGDGLGVGGGSVLVVATGVYVGVRVSAGLDVVVGV
jgi:hypothetical protein